MISILRWGSAVRLSAFQMRSMVSGELDDLAASLRRFCVGYEYEVEPVFAKEFGIPSLASSWLRVFLSLLFQAAFIRSVVLFAGADLINFFFDSCNGLHLRIHMMAS